MADMNECMTLNGTLKDFCSKNDLIDAVGVLNPDLVKDKTYLYGSKRIDFIFLSLSLADIAVKAGHHQFDQYLVSDHKGIYVHFRASDLFDTQEMDRSQHSYRRLQLGRRGIVEKYIATLENMYSDHRVLERTQDLAERIL